MVNTKQHSKQEIALWTLSDRSAQPTAENPAFISDAVTENKTLSYECPGDHQHLKKRNCSSIERSGSLNGIIVGALKSAFTVKFLMKPLL
ncbi:hypothetical protein SRHO_G00335010 [Serrasalmus rhombeus]